MIITDTELLVFLSELNTKRRNLWIADGGTAEHYDTREAIGCEIGPKYIRVVTHREKGNDFASRTRPVTTAAGVVQRVVGSAFCFLDKSNGDILKTASFASPAKGARGNIRQPWWGTAITPYGAAYLR